LVHTQTHPTHAVVGIGEKAMTTVVAESLLLDLKRRQHEVLDHSLPENEAQSEACEEGKVELRISTGRLHFGTILSVIAAVQLIWIGGLAYAVSTLLL
jgi:hypothetical protein